MTQKSKSKRAAEANLPLLNADLDTKISQNPKISIFFFLLSNGLLYGLGMFWGHYKWILGLKTPKHAQRL